MAAQWIVLHAGETIECDKCREAVEIARRRGLVRKYNVPAGLAFWLRPGDSDHAYVILGLYEWNGETDGVLVTNVCSSIDRLSYTAQMSFRHRWRRGWKRRDVRQYLELMALANEPEEKVWRDWQQAIMMTALAGR